MRKCLRKIVSAALGLALLAGAFSLPVYADSGNMLVQIDIWNAASDKPSMGNIATDNNKKALYNPKSNTLQLAANPVNVSGYMSGITAAKYDVTGLGPDKGSYSDVKVLSTVRVETGTKNDGTNHSIDCISSFEIKLPDYIKKTGVEYIPMKMSVPHTPMDIVVGKGFLDARLRIDWGKTEASSLSLIVPDVTMSSGTVQEIDRRDAASGLRVISDSTELPIESVMKVEIISSGEQYEAAKSSAAGESLTLYRLSFVVDGAEQQPAGPLEIYFPYLGQPKIYRINEGGSSTRLKGAASEDGYLILSSKLGIFAVSGGELMPGFAGASGGGEPLAEGVFKDTAGHWAEDYIKRAVSSGFFKGSSKDSFSPDAEMNRAMLVTVLYNMTGKPEAKASAHFSDVSGGSYYCSAVSWAFEQGIVSGVGGGLFAPEQKITREQLALILYKYAAFRGYNAAASSELSAFGDAGELSSYAEQAMKWAVGAGLISGSSGRLYPKRAATRAQLAVILCKFVDAAAAGEL